MSNDLERFDRTVKALPAFTAQATIPAKNIADLLITAFDGGSTYWIWKYKARVIEDARRAPWSFAWAPLTPGGSVTITAVNDREDGPGKKVELDSAALARGLLLFLKHGCCDSKELFDPDGCGIDQEGADVFLQLCVFGEVRYG